MFMRLGSGDYDDEVWKLVINIRMRAPPLSVVLQLQNRLRDFRTEEGLEILSREASESAGAEPQSSTGRDR